MGDMKESFDLMHEVHKERVAQMPDRIEYAIKQFKAADIKYELKNPSTGHFHCWRKRDGKLYQFYAGTGKIQGYSRVRGIHALVRMIMRNNNG